MNVPSRNLIEGGTVRSPGLRISLGEDPLDDIRALNDALIGSIEGSGIISVDQADIDMALAFGGELQVVYATGLTPDVAARAVIAMLHARRPLHSAPALAACCVHIRMPLAAGIDHVDQVVATLESSHPVVVSDQTLVVLSAQQEARSDVLVRLVTIQGE